MKKELCVQLVIYKDYSEIYGQQNIKPASIFYLLPGRNLALQTTLCVLSVHCNIYIKS
jgi:hypothetical protein